MLSPSQSSDGIRSSGIMEGLSDVDAGRSLAPPLLLQYWQVVIRWKWVIIGIMISALVAGLTITLLLTPKFTASAVLEISRDQKSITKVGGLDSENTGRDIEFYQTQYAT
jgi:polysaccharide biosynthesis transport protein